MGLLLAPLLANLLMGYHKENYCEQCGQNGLEYCSRYDVARLLY